MGIGTEELIAIAVGAFVGYYFACHYGKTGTVA